LISWNWTYTRFNFGNRIFWKTRVRAHEYVKTVVYTNWRCTSAYMHISTIFRCFYAQNTALAKALFFIITYRSDVCGSPRNIVFSVFTRFDVAHLLYTWTITALIEIHIYNFGRSPGFATTSACNVVSVNVVIDTKIYEITVNRGIVILNLLRKLSVSRPLDF